MSYCYFPCPRVRFPPGAILFLAWSILANGCVLKYSYFAELILTTVEFSGRKLAHRARAALVRGIPYIFEEKNLAWPARGGIIEDQNSDFVMTYN